MHWLIFGFHADLGFTTVNGFTAVHGFIVVSCDLMVTFGNAYGFSSGQV